MPFTLKYKDINEEREIPSDDYTIKDLLNELEVSAQTMVSKQNGELVIDDTVKSLLFLTFIVGCACGYVF